MNTKFKNTSGRVIGKISDNVFCKSVKKSKHLLRKWNAWGIDKAVMDNLVRDGIQKIIVHEKEEDVDYEVSVKDFVEKGVEAEYGHGKQIFLSLGNFQKKEDKNAEEAVLETERSKNGNDNS